MGHALTLDCGNTESGFRVPWARISTQPGKWQVGKCHVEASPELRFCKFRILDLRIVPPPPADRGAPNDLRNFYHPLESLEGNQSTPMPEVCRKKAQA